MGTLLRAAERALAILAGLALCAMMLLTFVDVIGRYGFNASIFGTAEYVEYLMVLVIFAGLAFVTARGEHIHVSILEARVRRLAPDLHRWTVVLFTGAVYAAIAWEMWDNALASAAKGKRTAVLDLPQWVMPAAAGLLSVVGVAIFAAEVARRRGHMPQADAAPTE